jgi:hypothetical protein
MEEITNPGKKGNKKKTNNCEIHKKPTPAGRERKPAAWAQLGSMPIRV